MGIMDVVYFILGLVLLVLGADWLIKGASAIAKKAGISSLVIGLTVVAFGTSSPELATNIQASLSAQPDIALGNVVGSNIFNVLFILGISAIITPLVVHKQLVKLDVPLMIFVSLCIYTMSFDGTLSSLDGGMLIGMLLAYVLFLIYYTRKQKKETSTHLSSKGSIYLHLFYIAIGLGALVLGSQWLVESAIAFARILGVSELIIALTIVAAGTSLPEVATSVLAAIKGERDIAVGNVIGSNIFNILGVLGLSALISPNGIPVSTAALGFDIPVMVIVAIATLPIFMGAYYISRWEGIIFVSYYAAYVTYIIFQAKEHDLLPLFSTTVVNFVGPMTLLTIAVLFLQKKKKVRS